MRRDRDRHRDREKDHESSKHRGDDKRQEHRCVDHTPRPAEPLP